jgi:dCTP deaminase
MPLRTEAIAKRLREADDLLGAGKWDNERDILVVQPMPNLENLRTQGAGSIDLRLGTWFLSLRQSRMPCLQPDSSKEKQRRQYARHHYVQFGKNYYLHPGSFVLGTTLEWVRIPRDLFGYVVGKSTLGRRGLVIATATAVHPGFMGCVSLELANIGEIPIVLKPGMFVCQLCLHDAPYSVEDIPAVDRSQHAGHRRAELGRWELNPPTEFLADAGES